MIIIDVIHLFLRHHVPEDGSQVDGAEGERLETEELAELCLAVLDDEHRVLDADTVLAFAIDARLVGDGHTCMERGRLPGVTNLVRSFVDAEVEPTP